MSFSQTKLVNAMHLLSTRLPQFPEQQNQVSRMLRIVTKRLSSHLNENLKAFGINENLWFSLMAVYVSPNSEILPSLERPDGLDTTTRLSDDMVERELGGRYINQKRPPSDCAKIDLFGETFIHGYGLQIARQSGQAWKISRKRIMIRCNTCWVNC